MSKEDVKSVYKVFQVADIHKFATNLQNSSEDDLEEFIRKNFAYDSPYRQTYRRAARWARGQTTEDVISAIKD